MEACSVILAVAKPPERARGILSYICASLFRFEGGRYKGFSSVDTSSKAKSRAKNRDRLSRLQPILGQLLLATYLANILNEIRHKNLMYV